MVTTLPVTGSCYTDPHGFRHAVTDVVEIPGQLPRIKTLSEHGVRKTWDPQTFDRVMTFWANPDLPQGDRL